VCAPTTSIRRPRCLRRRAVGQDRALLPEGCRIIVERGRAYRHDRMHRTA
jgi:hypothetical protein